MRFRTGNEAFWAPDGFRVFIDTSWDGRGTTIAVRSTDILTTHEGTPDTLGSVTIRDGAPVVVGRKVFRLRHEGQRCGGFGSRALPRLSPKEAESIFQGLLDKPEEDPAGDAPSVESADHDADGAAAEVA